VSGVAHEDFDAAGCDLESGSRLLWAAIWKSDKSGDMNIGSW